MLSSKRSLPSHLFLPFLSSYTLRLPFPPPSPFLPSFLTLSTIPIFHQPINPSFIQLLSFTRESNSTHLSPSLPPSFSSFSNSYLSFVHIYPTARFQLINFIVLNLCLLYCQNILIVQFKSFSSPLKTCSKQTQQKTNKYGKTSFPIANTEKILFFYILLTYLALITFLLNV